ACREPSPGPSSTPPVPVELRAPQLVEIAEPVRAIGRLESSEETRLAFKSPGVVGRLLVDIGDRVEPGQLLAELELTGLEAALTRAREELAKAERDLARAGELQRQQLIAREALDNARTARDLAAAALASARFDRRFAEIRASASGRVLARHVEPREVVAAGEPVLSVSSAERGWLLRVTVSDREAVRLEPGAAAELRFDAFAGERFPATVSRVAAQADPATATFAVELGLAEPDPRLLSGLIGHAEIRPRPEGKALLVPVAALVEAGDGQARLYVVEDGRAALRTVLTGQLRANGILVLDGLALADSVIVGGASRVDDGSPVRNTGPGG
ncbi:MAG: efflux RND transporter periplasmic adaptor subunit, partial [Gammaproteobacteria bacterium]